MAINYNFLTISILYYKFLHSNFKNKNKFDTIGIKSNTQNRLLHKTSQGIPVSAPGPGRD
jgi:hypothetical protein